jgi:surface polysaccharide O-acyltransferase-like enzyme
VQAIFDARVSREWTSSRFSETIGVARVICLLGIVYVHAWTGIDLQIANGTSQGLLRWMLTELLGRSAVPLLSMISGCLVAASIEKRSYWTFAAGKARVIILPMVLWNVLAILLVSGAAYAGLLRAPRPDTWWWTINELFCLTSPDDINVQMSFLRDLFICMLAAPFLVRLPNRSLLGIAAVTLVWMGSGETIILLLRPAILFFFVCGILAQRVQIEQRVVSWPLSLVAIPYALLASANVWFDRLREDAGASPAWLSMLVDVPMRVAAALFFWNLAWRLTGTSLKAVLLRVEPYVFLMFCSHLIMIWLGGPLIGIFTGPLGSPLYPPFLLVQPLLVLMAAVTLGRILQDHEPGAAFVLSGGRLKPGAYPGIAVPLRISVSKGG